MHYPVTRFIGKNARAVNAFHRDNNHECEIDRVLDNKRLQRWKGSDVRSGAIKTLGFYDA
jgi:hypothetical protein